MATWTVKQSGGDYSTLSSALSNASTGSGDTISIEGTWTGDDTTEAEVADTNLTIQTDASSRHPGYYDESTNHYRLNGTFSSAIKCDFSGVTIDGIAMRYAPSAETNDGIIELDADNITLKNCLACAANKTTGTQYGITVYGTGTNTITIENCISWGFERAGIQIGYDSTASITVNINSCTLWDNGNGDGSKDGGIINRQASGTPLINIFNTVCLASNGNADYAWANSDQATWDIHYSIDSDNSIASRDSGGVGNLASRTASDSDTPGTGDWVVFEDITTDVDLPDLRLKTNAENDAEEMHSQTDASPPLSTGNIPTADIVGTTRTAAYDCGAFEVSIEPVLAIDEPTHAHTAENLVLFLPGWLQQLSGDHEHRSQDITLIAATSETPVVEQVAALTEARTQAQQDTIGSAEGWSTPTSGNMLLMYVGAVPTSTDVAVTSPAGWTQVAENSVTGSRYQGLYWKVSDGTESTITFQRIGSGDVQCGAVAVELSGVDTSAGTDQFTVQFYNQTSAASRAFSTSITPNTNDAVFIAFWTFEDNDGEGYSYTNSYTIGDWDDDNSAADNTVGAGYKVISDGNFHTTTITETAPADDNYGYHIVVDAEEIPAVTWLNIYSRTHAHTADSPAVEEDGGATELVISDGAHAHAADALTLTIQDITLSVNDSTSAHAAESPTLTANDITLSVDEASHAHTAEALTLTIADIALAVQDALNAHAAESPAITANDITLAVDDGAHSHAADSPVLTIALNLVISDGTHAHAAESPTLTANDISLSVADSTHAHAAESPTLTISDITLAIADAANAHAAESPTLTANDISLSVADSDHAHAAEAPALTANDITLSVADSAHAHAAESPILDTTLSLAIADGAHAHGAEAPTLTANDISLSVADSGHAHVADNITLSLADADLSIAESTHAHTADSLTLAANDITLAINDALNAHAAEIPSLIANDITLAINDGAHGHSAESPALTTTGTISIADGAHALTSDSPALTADDINLVVADAAHAHAAESPVLVIAGALGIDDAAHAVTSDSPTLTADTTTLVLEDSSHAVSSDSPTLTIQDITFTVADGVHAHAADSPTLIADAITLSVNDSSHAHSSESPTLTISDLTLSVDDSTHAHAADSPTLEPAGQLGIIDSAHVLGSDNVTLTADDITLAANGSAHAHTAESLTLVYVPVLAIADAVHAVTSDEVTITDIGLAVADAIHAHAAESPALTLQDITLTVADALNGHVADSPTLTVAYLLAIAETLHTLASDPIALTVADISLAINDALHAHTADEPAIYQGIRVTPAHRRIEVLADDRNVGILDVPPTEIEQDDRMVEVLKDPRHIRIMRQDRVIDVLH